jgi:hypothetical protein
MLKYYITFFHSTPFVFAEHLNLAQLRKYIFFLNFMWRNSKQENSEEMKKISLHVCVLLGDDIFFSSSSPYWSPCGVYILAKEERVREHFSTKLISMCELFICVCMRWSSLYFSFMKRLNIKKKQTEFKTVLSIFLELSQIASAIVAS